MSVPAAEEYDYIARRMKELAAEREKRVKGDADPQESPTPATYADVAGEWDWFE